MTYKREQSSTAPSPKAVLHELLAEVALKEGLNLSLAAELSALMRALHQEQLTRFDEQRQELQTLSSSLQASLEALNAEIKARETEAREATQEEARELTQRASQGALTHEATLEGSLEERPLHIDHLELLMISCPQGKTRWGKNHLSAHISAPFELSKTVVTQALYTRLMGHNPSHFKGAQRPVEGVSFEEAQAFCNALSEHVGLKPAYPHRGVLGDPPLNSEGFRLPTPLEWEHAARAGRSKLSHLGVTHGARANQYAWFRKSSRQQTHDVLTKKLNDWGFDGLAGNVWEWCDARTITAKSPHTLMSVARGGAHNTNIERCWDIFEKPTSYYAHNLGFRVARSLIR